MHREKRNKTGLILGITLDEVIRDFNGHLSYVLSKYREKDIELTEEDITEYDLVKYFEFEDKEDMYKLFYEEGALETFGMPDQMHDNIMSKLNIFNLDMIDEEEGVEIIIIERAVSRAKGGTLFFLSKLDCEISEIKFVNEYEDMWNHVDVLVTANPIAIESKPEGKVCVKIDASYNKEVTTDFNFKTLMDFINATEIHESVFNKVETV